MDWLSMSSENIPGVIISTIGIYLAVIPFTRIAGLRSFSKISSFDFAMTVAVGSLIATTITLKNPPLLQSVVALATLYTLQMIIAYLRKGYKFINIMDNQPVLLMVGPNMLKENMDQVQLTREDILEKLREANVIHPDQMYAVNFETPGGVTVSHNNSSQHQLDPERQTLRVLMY